MTLETLTDDVEWEEPAPRPLALASRPAGAVLALAYVVTAAWFGDRVPRGTTVAGVAVGGQAAGEAAPRSPRLGAAAAQPLVLTRARAGREPPKDVGLAVDVAATVDGLVGFSLSPATMWAPRRRRVRASRPS